MIKHKDHFHGSDLEKIEEIYGIKKEEIVSFSANVNPLGVSPLLRTTLADKIDAITTYPDREYTSLRKCIAAYCGTDYENVIVGNGSTELISLFIQIEHPKKAMIIGPTYSEYEREISLGGGTTLYYPLREKDDFRLDVNDFISHLNENIDLLVICNPNNPTSSCITSADMRHILDACKEYDIYVMVDETYVEFAENMEEIDSVPLTNYTITLSFCAGPRSFSQHRDSALAMPSPGIGISSRRSTHVRIHGRSTRLQLLPGKQCFQTPLTSKKPKSSLPENGLACIRHFLKVLITRYINQAETLC